MHTVLSTVYIVEQANGNPISLTATVQSRRLFTK